MSDNKSLSVAVRFSCAICQSEKSLKACTGCGNIFYCSIEHQKHDWKKHKGNCRAYRLSSDDKNGKSLEAKRDIKCGQVVFSEQPIVIGPDWSYDLFEIQATFNCVGCFEPIRVLTYRCPECKWPCCQPACVGLQNAKLHDIECSLLKASISVKHESDYENSVRDYYRSDLLLLVKCLAMQAYNPKKYHELMELKSHVDARRATKNYSDSQPLIDYVEKFIVEPLLRVEKKSKKIIIPQKDRKTLETICGIIETNASYLTNDNALSGLYALGGLIQHSCLPNCHFSFDKRNGFNLTVRAARDIVKGEAITTCFTSILWGTQMRRQQLKETKYFDCTCARCSDPIELGTHFSSLKCIGTDELACDGGIQVPTNQFSDAVEWICDKCPCRIAGDQVALFMSKVGEEVDNCMRKTPNPAAVETLMDKLSIFLHPQHFHMFNLKYSLVQLYGNHIDYPMASIPVDALMRKLSLADNLLGIVKRLDPHSVRLSIYTAVVLYEKFNSIVEMQRRQMATVSCTLAEAVDGLRMAQTILTNELDSDEGKRMNDKISDAIQMYTLSIRRE